MVIPYLEVDKLIISNKGKFIIKELIDDYVLINADTEERVTRSNNINDFRKFIGEIKDVNMKFIVNKTSDWTYKEEVEISSLDELLKMVTDNKNEIIIGQNDGEWYIEIYDAYRR